MLDWLLRVVEEAQGGHFTGRLRIDFRHGRPQHMIRSTLLCDTPTGPTKDLLDVFKVWTGQSKTGFVDIYLLAGAIVDIQESDMLFPPRANPTEECPGCRQHNKLKRGPDYGNLLVCSACGWQGTEQALRTMLAKREVEPWTR